MATTQSPGQHRAQPLAKATGTAGRAFQRQQSCSAPYLPAFSAGPQSWQARPPCQSPPSPGSRWPWPAGRRGCDRAQTACQAANKRSTAARAQAIHAARRNHQRCPSRALLDQRQAALLPELEPAAHSQQPAASRQQTGSRRGADPLWRIERHVLQYAFQDGVQPPRANVVHVGVHLLRHARNLADGRIWQRRGNGVGGAGASGVAGSAGARIAEGSRMDAPPQCRPGRRSTPQPGAGWYSRCLSTFFNAQACCARSAAGPGGGPAATNP